MGEWGRRNSPPLPHSPILPFPHSPTPPFSHSPTPPFLSKAGFTLLELLISISVLVVAMVIVYQSFSTTLKAYQRGNDLLDELHHGDYVMEQMVTALRSAAFFETVPHLYGFRMDDGQAGRYPGDLVSVVTGSSAFMPVSAELARGLHRLVVTIEDDEEGDAAVAVRAFPFLADYEDRDTDPWFISSQVKGLKCRVFNFEDEDWETEWPNTNDVPARVEITLYMDPVEEYGNPVKMIRVVDIPVGTTNWVTEAEMRRPGGGGR